MRTRPLASVAVARVLAVMLAAGLPIATVFVPASRAAPPAGDFDAIDAHVQAAMAASAVPGLGYAIVREGSVVHLAAFGVADRGGRAMTPQTPVVVGSVGKSMTALAIRQLVESGRVDLDASVTTYLPSFTLAGPEAASDAITVRTLLEHTSGLSTADGQERGRYAPGLTSADILSGLSEVRPDRPVGTYEYSNLNYVILGAVIEAVSQQSYGEYLAAHVFTPLGMDHSFTSLDAAGPAGLATGHRYLFGLPVPFEEPYPTGMIPAGYQISTTADMANFAAALSAGGVFHGIDVTTGNAPSTATRYLGTDWEPLGSAPSGVVSSQSGSTLSSNADLLVAPGDQIGVVVLMNANPTQLLGLPEGASDIALDVLRLAGGATVDSSPPTVRTVYLVVDGLLVAFAVLFGVHLARARSWTVRLGRSRHERLFVARAIGLDLILPLAVLVGLPLWIGSTGSSASGDVFAGWRFAWWTMPDITAVILILAVWGLVLGALKLRWATRVARESRAGA